MYHVALVPLELADGKAGQFVVTPEPGPSLTIIESFPTFLEAANAAADYRLGAELATPSA